MEKRRIRTGIELTNGPGKMTIAMGIDQQDDGHIINLPPLYLSNHMKRLPKEIHVSERIGIPNKGEWTTAPLRYSVKGNPFVSRMRKRDMKEDGGWMEEK